MSARQLTRDERIVIHESLSLGLSSNRIARQLGRHPATITREIARNRDPRGHYHPELADLQAHQRRTLANQARNKLTGPLLNYLKRKLWQRWSPEQIASRIRRDHPDDPSMRLSHETIYRWVYAHRHDHACWCEQLRTRRPKRRQQRKIGSDRRGQIPGRVGIEHRPPQVAQRQTPGHWESDTVEGRKGSGLIVSHVERFSRYAVFGWLPNKQATNLSRVSSRQLGRLPEELRLTMTVDNGKEFADFATMQQRLGMTVYFANPRSPWERGTNENTNGLLRDFFPKGYNFRHITPRQLANVQQMLNNRPRKCLNYLTPAEVLARASPIALRN